MRGAAQEFESCLYESQSDDPNLVADFYNCTNLANVDPNESLDEYLEEQINEFNDEDVSVSVKMSCNNKEVKEGSLKEGKESVNSKENVKERESVNSKENLKPAEVFSQNLKPAEFQQYTQIAC